MYKAESIQPLTVIGLMSGTSVDAVDACCARLSFAGGKLEHEILATHTRAIPEELRTRLLKAMADKHIHLEELCRLNVAVGELFAETAQTLIEANHLNTKEIECIGSHGQTLYHWPPEGFGQLGGTLQIGEPSIIAEKTGIRTIADFRPRDMAAGGQGAPLVCFADLLLFQDEQIGRCIQNIGGIANVTVVPSRQAQKEGAEVIAFDTGPGNMLMDAAMERFFGKPYDTDGTIAAQGNVNQEMLGDLLTHSYFTQPPPKTTGRELFGLPFLNALLEKHSQLSPEDLLATLNLFTAQSIADAYEQFVFSKYSIQDVVLGGGGVYNHTLRQNLEKLFQSRGHQVALKTHADYGIPDKYKEALAFAILAWASILQRPNNIPSCTGAGHPVIMGKHIF